MLAQRNLNVDIEQGKPAGLVRFCISVQKHPNAKHPNCLYLYSYAHTETWGIVKPFIHTTPFCRQVATNIC